MVDGSQPRLDALPYNFTRFSTPAQQRRSLSSHAEKRALAELLSRRADTLEIDINFKVCVDCHAFFEGASELLQREISVREPKLVHTFVNGTCSCRGQWRWEERSRRAR